MRILTRAFMRSVTFVILCLIGAGPSYAAPFTYSFLGIASGSLESEVFTDRAFEIVAVIDTISISSPEFGIIQASNLQATIDIAEIGLMTFTVPTVSVVNRSLSSVGIGDTSQNLAIVFVQNDSFANYDLTTATERIGGPTFSNACCSFGTSAGALMLTDFNNVTFQAINTAVPEPSSLALLAVGTVALILSRRRLAPAR